MQPPPPPTQLTVGVGVAVHWLAAPPGGVLAHAHVAVFAAVAGPGRVAVARARGARVFAAAGGPGGHVLPADLVARLASPPGGVLARTHIPLLAVHARPLAVAVERAAGAELAAAAGAPGVDGGGACAASGSAQRRRRQQARGPVLRCVLRRNLAESACCRPDLAAELPAAHPGRWHTAAPAAAAAPPPRSRGCSARQHAALGEQSAFSLRCGRP